MFRHDVAKMQRFYISNGLKKLNRVSVRDFVQQIQHLDGYFDLLPCLYYSSRVTQSIMIIGPFDDADLASHIIRMVPRTWQDQYKLRGVENLVDLRNLIKEEVAMRKYPLKLRN